MDFLSNVYEDEFGSKKWKETFYKQSELTTIIDSIEIEKYKFLKIEKKYTVTNDNDRIGAVVQIEQNGRLKRVIIDVIDGSATYDQIMDVKFNIGNDCDYYIVIHNPLSVTRRSFKDDRENEDDFINVECLVDVLCAYDVKLYMAVAERLTQDDGCVRYQYASSEYPTYSSVTISKKLPSKRQFEQAEFIMFHWGGGIVTMGGIFEPDNWYFGRAGNLEMGGYFDSHDINFISNWTDDGLFMNAVSKTDKGIELLNWLWKNRREELQDKCKGYKMSFQKRKGRPARLSVRVLDKPFKEVPHSDYNERDRFGEIVYLEEYDFREYVEDLLTDMPVDLK